MQHRKGKGSVPKWWAVIVSSWTLYIWQRRDRFQYQWTHLVVGQFVGREPEANLGGGGVERVGRVDEVTATRKLTMVSFPWASNMVVPHSERTIAMFAD